MIQLFAYDEDNTRTELDLYKDEVILLNSAIEDIIDISRIDSAFSRTFRVPATGTNSRFFKWWYQSNAIDFDVTKIVKADIHIDGIFYRTGQLRLQAVYNNMDTQRIDIEVAFLGETKQFGTQLGDTYMDDLDCSDVDHVLNHTFLHDSQLPFTDPSLPFDGAVRYALAIRGYTYDEDGNILENGQITFDNTRQKSFTSQPHHITEDQYTPFLQVKYLIDKIFAETGFTYSDDSVFNQEWFKFLYTEGIATASSTTPTSDSDALANVLSGYPISSVGISPVILPNVVTNNGNGYNVTTGEYTVSVPTTVTPYPTIQYVVEVADQMGFFGGAPVFTWRLYKNGTAIQTIGPVTGTGTPGQQVVLSRTLSYTGATAVGDVFFATIEVGGVSENPYITNQSVFSATGTPDAVRIKDLLKQDYTKLDFFKDILTRFRLVMSPSKSVESQFVVKPWIEYIGSGDFFDWTYKMDLTKDVVMKPIFDDQSSVINFTDKEGLDNKNIFHQYTQNQVYGYRPYDSQNPLLSGSRDVITNMAPTPVDQIIGWEKVPETLTTVLPYFATINEEAPDKDGYAQLAPMVTIPRLLFWNGYRPCSWDNSQWFYDLTSPGVKHYEYACMSYLSMLDSTPNTLDLNWQKDIQYFEVAGNVHSPDGSQGFDVYQRFWADYINTLYSKDSRMMTAYFVLTPQDLANLSFDDTIWIKDSYWRLHRIIDAPLDGTASVKAELIKLYTYPETGFANQDIETLSGTSGGGGGGVETYYAAVNCENPEDLIVVKYGSAIPLGYVITTTGSGHIGQCYELISTVTPQAYLPITNVYEDCLECAAAQ